MHIEARNLSIGDVLLSPGFRITVDQVEELDQHIRVHADTFTLLYSPDELVEIE